MIKRNSYSITLLLTGIFCSVLVTAQTKVRASVDKTAILIGEQVNLRLEADIPSNQPIRFFQLDSLPHFEILEKQKIDTSDTEGGTLLAQVIRITSFDSGHWVIPQFVLGGNLATDSIGMDVGYTAYNPEQPYHDIKDIIEVKPEEEKKKETWWYYIAGGLLLIILLIVLLSRKKKKPEIKIAAPPPDAYSIAMEALEHLKKQKVDARYYYSKLVDIFREYVHDKKDIQLMQQTTDDLVVKLRDLKMPKEAFDRLAQSLRLSDYVKFAKYEPTQEDDRTAFDVIKASIDYIEQMQ